MVYIRASIEDINTDVNIPRAAADFKVTTALFSGQSRVKRAERRNQPRVEAVHNRKK